MQLEKETGQAPGSGKTCGGKPKTVLAFLKEKVFRKVQTDLYDGWQEAEDFNVEASPSLTWKGTLLPFSLWEQIVCFMRWSQKTHTAEALLHLFYNADAREWAADVFPQEPNGMSVRSLENDPEYAVVRSKYGRGWIQFGSVHHHCGMSAFQSGTDHADERDRDGLHITLGKMHETKLDIHCRVVLGGMTYDTSIALWIERPAWAEQVPPTYRSMLNQNSICLSCTDRPFPEEWKQRIKKPVYTTYCYSVGQPTTHGHVPTPSNGEWYQKNGWVYNPATGLYESPGAHEKKRTDDSADEKGKKESKPSSATEAGTEWNDSGPDQGNLQEAKRAEQEKFWTGREGKILSDFDIATLRTVNTIISDIGIDFGTAYDLMSTHPTQCTTENLAIRTELFRVLRNNSINYMYAETLMEKIGADKIRTSHK